LPLFLEMLLTMNEHKGQWDKKNFTKRTYWYYTALRHNLVSPVFN
jgi:hypothetical protein